MSQTLFDVLPADRRDQASDALRSAFGSAPLTAVQPIYGGASGALIYRAESGGRSYVLRLEKIEVGGYADPQRSFACMQIAAEAGIAPALHYADPAAGVAIMDFVGQRPLSEHPDGPRGVARDLGDLTRRLQATPAFPAGRADYLTAIQYLLGVIRGSSLFKPGALDPHVEGFARIRAAYPSDATGLVSSHNDPNPRNVLFDGERFWLIDWELSYRNDPFVDLAILADNFAKTPETETALLTARFGGEPDAATRARLTLMRPVTRLFYGCIGMFGLANAPRETPEDLTAPTVEEFTAAIGDGRLSATGPETLFVLGKMCLAGFLAGVAAPGFDEALVAARQG